MTTVELPRYQHVIDGRRVEAASGQRYDSVDPYLGAPWASAADGDAADVDARGGGGPAGAGRAVGPAHRVRPGRADAPARRPDRAGRGPAGRDRDPRYGQAAARDARAAGHDPAVVLLLLRAGGQARGHHDPGRQAELPRLHPARAGRRGRGDRAVELPAAAAVLEAGPGAGRGLHDGGQAVGLLPGLGGRAGRADGRGRVPAGRVQRGDRVRARGGQGAGRPPGRGQDRVHRLDRGRRAGGGGGRGEHHRGAAGAGRQVRARGLRRRRPGRGVQRRAGRGVRRHRADLHGGLPAAGVARRARRAGAAHHRPGPVDQARRPEGGRHRDGPGGHRAAVPQGAVVPGGRGQRGRDRGGGRPSRRRAWAGSSSSRPCSPGSSRR